MATKISWVCNDDGSAGATWNPIVGCTKISPGCARCYAECMARRQVAMGFARAHKRGGEPDEAWIAYQSVVDWGTGKWNGKLAYRDIPVPKADKIFVCSMSDLFHEEAIRLGYANRVFDRMADVRYADRTFLILTKRIDNALAWIADNDMSHPVRDWDNMRWGATCENQEWLIKRVRYLLQIPAAVRFLSLEPLLGSIDLNVPIAGVGDLLFDYPNRIHQVMVGPETGPGRRPCELAWIKSIVDQCHIAGVPVHVKAVPLKGQIVTDPDGISDVLDMPIEAIRQWPKPKEPRHDR